MPSKTFKISWENEKVTTKEIENLLYNSNVITFKVQELKECDCENNINCSFCGKSIKSTPKPIEKLEHQTRWDMDKLVVAKINEIIDRINKEGV